MILVAANTDPYHTQWANINLDLTALGIPGVEARRADHASVPRVQVTSHFRFSATYAHATAAASAWR